MTVTARQIQRAVAYQFGITAEHIRSYRIDPKTLRARYIALYLTREMTNLSNGQIAMQFNRKNIRPGIRKGEQLATKYPREVAFVRVGLKTEV